MQLTSAPSSEGEYRERLSHVGLGGAADALCSLVRPGIELVPVPASEGGGTGRSRLGGEPDLPDGFPWPERDGRPLSFLLQVDLAEAAAVRRAEELPEAGLLSFFYDAVEQPWGFDPADRGGWQVHHFSGPGLGRRAAPASLGDEGRFRTAAVSFRPRLMFPPAESFDAERIVGSVEEAWRRYGPVLGEERLRGYRTHLLGHPEPVQGDMQVECQLASNGVYVGDGQHRDRPAVKDLLDGSTEWRLLAQVDSHEEETDMMWGDSGRIYFWIRSTDLRDRRWDRCWVVLQCS